MICNPRITPQNAREHCNEVRVYTPMLPVNAPASQALSVVHSKPVDRLVIAEVIVTTEYHDFDGSSYPRIATRLDPNHCVWRSGVTERFGIPFYPGYLVYRFGIEIPVGIPVGGCSVSARVRVVTERWDSTTETCQEHSATWYDAVEHASNRQPS
ncbi:uncharacterized protein EI90DRAFT_3035055 [Cantharellus anzutake]|uniref:uncharacterized protein n=1 Tax=Cantharellus anzutake TaxID=1750568 RepID=UPI0019052445|nr:uncharacterized protein EI90DRAFT_3079775 [Cantharellus anzutake]XP_038921640.1 uncharacterized protein EI90DRAFT_3035055 [Cantharellus anzutake]KAF8320981.1 hypothetical protein EI90DRAFT_3079775 [Cantharellus anzutake]KAF8340278.1 hypothetical protein EI90DRAFT_3035055 [Cantharellus anzutake]